MTPRQPEQVLVTGGGGFLGRAICERLSRRGDRVASFSRSRHPALDDLGVAQITGDIRDLQAAAAACSGMDLVFHVAARPGVWGRYEDFFSVNVAGTRNMIDGCRTHGVPRLIYTSSPSVVFDGSDMAGVDESVPYPARYDAAYPETKAIAEKEVIAAGRSRNPAAVCLRPHLIWGPRDNHLVPRIIERAEKLKRVGKGGNRVDTIYVDNAAEAHILAADRLAESPELSGRVYFISQDDPIPVWEMVDRILAAAGKPPVKGRVSFPVAWAVGLVLEAVYGLMQRRKEPPMTRFVARELATAHWFDISAARKDLGYEPKVSTAEGLRRLEKWLKERRTSNAGHRTSNVVQSGSRS